MQSEVLLSLAFEILRLRKTTAPYLAEKYSLSTRTVYRYVEKLTPFLPLHVRRGRQGGIYLSDSYRLPVDFFTAEEYDAALSALSLAYAKTPEEKFLSAKQKIAKTRKNLYPSPLPCGDCGDFLLLPTKNEEELAQKLRCAQISLREKKRIRLLYPAGDFLVEPHLLLLRGGSWFLHAFCLTRRAFYPFPLAACKGILLTEDIFHPRPVLQAEILQSFPAE